MLKLQIGAKGGWRLASLVLLFVAIFIAPLVALLSSLAAPPTETVRFLWEHRLPRQLATTVLICTATVVATTLVGSACGWLVARYHFPGVRLFEWLLVMPLTIPTYVMAYCLRGFFDYSGPLAELFRGMGWEYPFHTLTVHGVGAALFVLVATLYPYVYIISRHTFRVQSRTLLEAAELHSSRGLFWRVGVPLARPALVGAGALVVMETLNEFGALFYLGVDTITTAIFGAWFNYNDLRSATQIASYALLIVVVVAIIEIRSRTSAQHNYGLAPWTPPHRIRLSGYKRWIATVWCALPVMIAFVMPLVVLLYWVGVANFDPSSLLRAARHSVTLATTTTALCVMCGLLVAYGRRIIDSAPINVLVLTVSLGYALPGAVIAVGLMRSVGFLIPLGSAALLIYGYLFRHLAVCYHPINAALEQTCRPVDNAASLLGASHLHRLLRINIPHMRYTLIGATLLVFLDLLKELPLTIILRPFGIQTLALETFYFMSEEQHTAAAPSALLMVIIATVLVLIIEYAIRGTKPNAPYSQPHQAVRPSRPRSSRP